MNSGVYKITCSVNSNYYYGSSVNLKSRFKNHISKLRLQKHRNHRLQKTFNKYGENSFIFEVVEYCDPLLTTSYEQKYLDAHTAHNKCMNFCKSAFAPMAGIKFSEEHKRKMAEVQFRNKYIFTYQNGNIKEFNSLTEVSNAINVKKTNISRWFKRKNLGRNHGILNSLGVVKAEKTGDENIVLNPYGYKQEPWILAGASSKTQYYREKRKNKINY